MLTNAVAPIRVTRAFLDRVRDGTGIVAFMSSGLGGVAGKTDSYSELYSASKAALNSLSRSFAASLGGRRVTVLAVAPGWVRTDMGGGGAPLAVEDSVRGVVDVLESRAGTEPSRLCRLPRPRGRVVRIRTRSGPAPCRPSPMTRR